MPQPITVLVAECSRWENALVTPKPGIIAEQLEEDLKDMLAADAGGALDDQYTVYQIRVKHMTEKALEALEEWSG